MTFDILTLFPEAVESMLGNGLNFALNLLSCLYHIYSQFFSII